MNENTREMERVESNQNNSGVKVGADGSIVETDAYQELSVREQMAVLDQHESADTREVLSAEASPEDYLLDRTQVDVEEESAEASIRDVVEARDAATEKPEQRCGIAIDAAKHRGSHVSAAERVLGRTVGETYLVMGEGLAFGVLVRFDIIKPGASFEASNASGGSAVGKNEPADVHIEARITKVTGRDTMGITTEGDLDVEDTSDTPDVIGVSGPGHILVDETLHHLIPDDAKWFVR